MGDPGVEALSGDFERRFFSGVELWGECLTDRELAEWLEDEREGYADLGYEANDAYKGYEYSELSVQTGWRHLPDREWGKALGIGSATGVEFLPVVGRLTTLSIVEPSQQLRSTSIQGIPIEFVDPHADGTLPFEADAFDLVVCFSVLHHIAKVSSAISEMARCARPGGYVLLREPIVSMGDWRAPRPGLTSRERGIPLQLFRRAVLEAGFEIEHEELCGFSLVGRLRFLGEAGPYTSRLGVWLDRWLCRFSRLNYRYHARTRMQRLRPTTVAYVLRKPAACSE